MTATRESPAVALLAALLAVAPAGCGVATVAGVTGRIDRKVVGSAPSTEREAGEVVVRDVAWDGDRLTAHIERDLVCHDYLIDEVHEQDLRILHTRNVWGEGLGGLGMVAAGGVLLAIAPGASTEHPLDPDTSKEQLSEQEKLALGGVVLGVLGVAGIAHAWSVGRKGGTRKAGAMRVLHEERASGPSRVCGKQPAPAGELVFRFGSDIVGAEEIEHPEALAIDLRAGEVCKDGAQRGTDLTIAWVADGAEYEVASHDVTACSYAHAADEALVSVQGALVDSAPAAQLAEARARLDAADAAVSELPAGDPDRAALAATSARLRERVAQAASAMIDASLTTFRAAAAGEDIEVLVDRAADAIAIGGVVPARRRQVWDEVYGGLVPRLAEHGLAGVRALAVLYRRDLVTGACVTAGNCPPWLTRDAAIASVAPLAARLAGEVARAAASLARDGTRLKRRVGDDSFARFTRSVAATDEALGWCENDAVRPAWGADVVEPCGRLRAQRDAAEELGQDAEATLRERRVARTARAWRAIFPRCRAIQTVRDGLQRESSCTGPCVAVLQKAARDYERLQAITIDGELDDVTRDDVRGECREAGCPTCP